MNFAKHHLAVQYFVIGPFRLLSIQFHLAACRRSSCPKLSYESELNHSIYWDQRLVLASLPQYLLWLFSASTTNPSVLTSNKINITCVRRNAGYVFTISNILREELHPNVVGIADEVTQASYYTVSWIALWLIGIVAAVEEMFIFLPLTWYGTRRLNGYSTLVSFVCSCSSYSLQNPLLTCSDFIHLISSRLVSCNWTFPESISQQDVSLCALRRRVLCHVIYNNGFNVCCVFLDTH